jgi:hypothetical protein
LEVETPMMEQILELMTSGFVDLGDPSPILYSKTVAGKWQCSYEYIFEFQLPGECSEQSMTKYFIRALGAMAQQQHSA